MKCQKCGRELPDEMLFEGLICFRCKQKQDSLDHTEELRAFVDDMLAMNHKGEFCWTDGHTYCQEGWCLGCQKYLDWRKKWNGIPAQSH
jgi:hypothetical protein